MSFAHELEAHMAAETMLTAARHARRWERNIRNLARKGVDRRVLVVIAGSEQAAFPEIREGAT